MLNSVSSFTHLLNLCASFRFGSVLLSLQFYILSSILRFPFPLILVHSHSHFSVKIILQAPLLLFACAVLFIAPFSLFETHIFEVGTTTMPVQIMALAD